MQSFTHTHEGQSFTISVRLCPDGFVDGATRAAVAHAFAGLINYRDILGDARNADELMDLITTVTDASGQEVHRPWKTWQRGIDASALDEMAAFFFNDLDRKLNGSRSSKTPMPNSSKVPTRTKEMTVMICEMLTSFQAGTSLDPSPLPSSPGHTTA